LNFSIDQQKEVHVIPLGSAQNFLAYIVSEVSAVYVRFFFKFVGFRESIVRYCRKQYISVVLTLKR